MTPKCQSIIDHKLPWLLLDSALIPEPLWFAKGAGLNCLSLFSAQDKPLEDKGPWLIYIEEQSDFIELVLKQNETGHGSVWFSSPLEQEALVKALRMRLYVEKPDGQITRFRYYDPRVLHHYLHAESLPRLQEFMTPFHCLVYAELNPFRFESNWNIWQCKTGQWQHTSALLTELSQPEEGQ